MSSKALGRSSLVVMAALAGVTTVGGARFRLLAAEKPVEEDAAVVAARQQLVGEWTLNAQLSEDPREKMRLANPQGGRPDGGGPPGGGGSGGGWGGGGGGHGHGGGGYGGHGGGGHGGSPGGPPGGGEEPARPMLFTASRITVTNLTPTVTILDPEGEVRQLHADDKASREENGNEVKAKWDGGLLVVETKTPRGSVKETWTVSAEPRRLTVRLDIKRSFGGEVTVKRVFDAPTDAPAR
jgi:hypothetical protein